VLITYLIINILTITNSGNNKYKSVDLNLINTYLISSSRSIYVIY
jgi:hypothetical protein